MPNNNIDALFQLIKSLSKGEKRNFKLYITRNTAKEDLKVVQLFDALDKQEGYDEKLLLAKNAAISKQQLPNLKAHLYKEILASLRVISDDSNVEIFLNEQLNNARILFNKGLYLQCLKIIEKVKDTASINNQFTYLQQAIFFEKKIETLYITRSMASKADSITKEAKDISQIINNVSVLSNLSLKLYSWYITNGFAHNDNEVVSLNDYLQSQLPENPHLLSSFYERLYLYQSYCWRSFIAQDFLQHYRYAQKWVRLFEEQTNMLAFESVHFIKGMHNLMSAHYYLGNATRLEVTLSQFKSYSETKAVQANQNAAIQCFLYYTISNINYHFLTGEFKKGLNEVPAINQSLQEYEGFIDPHRVLVINYKIACLYFGAGDFDTSIDYLNEIINNKTELRNDLQCYARLLHLIAHYEIGNYNLLEYLAKSVYRFMAKMQSLSTVEEELFTFLKNALTKNAKELNVMFAQLLEKLKSITDRRYETRAFMYLDVISWLESKLNKTPVEEVVRQNYMRKN